MFPYPFPRVILVLAGTLSIPTQKMNMFSYLFPRVIVVLAETLSPALIQGNRVVSTGTTVWQTEN